MKLLCIAGILAVVISTRAGDLETIGVTLLRQLDPALTGTGVHVALVEPPVSGSLPPPFQVNPSVVSLPGSLFTYSSTLGTANGYPNAVGAESYHANAVGGNYFGLSTGAAPGVAHIYNYEAGYFYNTVIGSLTTPSIAARVVNQSFIFGSNETAVNQNYDNYAADKGTLFVSGVSGTNTSDPVIRAPATCYNGIGVSAFGAFIWPGPTSDGRCKPDISAPDQAHAPNSAVSYATAYVSGSAAVLLQAAARGDGGANTSAATNLLTLKALLLNGAVKPNGWTNGPATPLDARYGSGVVNVFNSWHQLKGGQRPSIETTTVNSGGAHPPGANTNNVPSLVGWDHRAISTTQSQDKINHYYFQIGTNSHEMTATLTWNRQKGKSSINNLNLFLVDVATSNLVACSTSLVDNVEHIRVPQLPPGRYDLQVVKRGNGQVSSSETYALAFEFVSLQLSIAQTNGNVMLSWPAAPTGFQLQSAPALNPATTWGNVLAPVSTTTNPAQCSVILPIGAGNEFFRLRRP